MSPPHFTEPEVSEENIPESLTGIVKSILFVEEETAKQISYFSGPLCTAFS